jgi:hypothetical protein
MSLDVLTERGRQTLYDEMRMSASLESIYGYRYISTPKDQPAVSDALILDGNQIYAVAETKCRYDMECADDFFEGEYNSEWLLTFDKYMKNCDVARALCIPLVGIIVLPNSNEWLVKRLYEGATNTHLAHIRLDTTKTQATVNGGVAVRTNAFINMRGAKVNKLLGETHGH